MRDAGKRGRLGAALVAGILLAALLACAGRAPSPPPPDPDPLDRDYYRIGITDLLRVSVWRNDELSVDVPVRPDGKISVPLVDDVQAEGLTPSELKEVLSRELSEYIASPQVTVIVLQMNSQFVSILGGVKGEGRIPLTRDMRVVEAIASAGGFTAFADKGDIRIVRRHPDGSEHEYRFDYGAYVKGKAPGTNIVLRNGDTILVPD
jgi:polysaccharide export outer membrane protein